MDGPPRRAQHPTSRPPTDPPSGTVARQFTAAMLTNGIGLLPVFAVGALATLIRPELDFDEAALGIAIASFFASSAALSLPAGAVAEAWGPVRASRWAVCLAAVALAGIGGLATSWATLLPWMVIAGAANALAQVATNGLVAQVIPPERNGLAFGVKQSAGPLFSLAAGASVPLIGLTVGWRWAFVCAALLAVPTLLVLGRAAASTTRRRRSGTGPLHDRGPLVLLAITAALGAGAVNCLNAFYIESMVRHHLELGLAGVYFAVGGLSGVVVRVLAGWWSDRVRTDRLVLASGMLACSALAFLGLAVLDTALIVVTLLAFGAGWGWNGLVLAAVVDAYPEAPSAATSITQAGLYAGAVVMPTTFGFLVGYQGFAAAWTCAAASLAVAAALLLVVSRRNPGRGRRS